MSASQLFGEQGGEAVSKHCKIPSSTQEDALHISWDALALDKLLAGKYLVSKSGLEKISQ